VNTNNKVEAMALGDLHLYIYSIRSEIITSYQLIPFYVAIPRLYFEHLFANLLIRQYRIYVAILFSPFVTWEHMILRLSWKSRPKANIQMALCSFASLLDAPHGINPVTVMHPTPPARVPEPIPAKSLH
jgi:hypothetical protein